MRFKVIAGTLFLIANLGCVDAKIGNDEFDSRAPTIKVPGSPITDIPTAPIADIPAAPIAEVPDAPIADVPAAPIATAPAEPGPVETLPATVTETPAVPVVSAPASPAEIVETVIETPLDVDLSPIADESGETYLYDHKAKACVNELGEIGLNDNAIGVCAKGQTRIEKINLSALELMGIHFENARISQVNFDKANLTGATIIDSVIDKSTFKGTFLKDSEFAGTTIHQSDLSDFDALQQLLDGGIKLGLENQLPALFKEIDSILAANFEGAGEGRAVASEDDFGKLQPAAREELRKIQGELDKQTQLVRRNREVLNGRRSEFHELRRQRDRHGRQLKETYERFSSHRSRIKELLEELRTTQKKSSQLKENYRQNKGGREKLKDELVENQRREKSLYKEIRDLKKGSSREVPEAAQLAKDVRDLVNETVTQQNALSAIRSESLDCNAQIKGLVSRYHEILKSQKYAAQ